ncbi:MAG: sensor histidine kinase, partial [Acidimicrobiales bacterium]
MTLRLRLVAAIFVLVTAGLVAFGVVTNALYAQSAYQRLDAQIRSLAPLIDQELDNQAGHGAAGPPYDGGSGGALGGQRGSGGPSPVVPPGTYAELRSASGAVLVAPIPFGNGAAQPRLPATLPPPTANGRLFNVGTTTGSGGFRVLEIPARDGGTTLIAVPSTEVTNAVHNLLLIEVGGSAVLLVLLSAGSWLVLRRGLRPLERMAGQARSITAGDLSQRVSPAGGGSEVGQLGLALNTMLGDIEAAFAEREAIELRLRRFLADASHELRTPLTSIQGFAELFRISGEDAGVDLPTILRRIEQETARMKVLVEDLLLLARLDEPRTVARDPVDLAVLAADACSDAVATAPDRPITLVAPQPVVVAGDQIHLRQAIANLVTNAVRHTPPGTPIEVAARLGDGAAEIAVRDHGPGLSDDALTHAFERFWQADRARVGPGAGLGLAIVASIAVEHGGGARAANAPGGGAE